MLDIIVAKDEIKTGDFWREYSLINFTLFEEVRTKSHYDLAHANSLTARRLGVPKMYIGEDDPGALWRALKPCQPLGP